MELQTPAKKSEEQFRLMTLEDCLNLALKLRITSKSGADEIDSHRLCLRLIWLLIHSGLPLEPLRFAQLQHLAIDLSSYLRKFPMCNYDLNLYRASSQG